MMPDPFQMNFTGDAAELVPDAVIGHRVFQTYGALEWAIQPGGYTANSIRSQLLAYVSPVKRDENLYPSNSYFRTPISTGVNTAQCIYIHESHSTLTSSELTGAEARAHLIRSSRAKHTCQGLTDDQRVEFMDLESHPICSPLCTCGFYAYFNLRDSVYGLLPAQDPSNYVYAAVRGTGRATVGSLGFRVQNMEVLALAAYSDDRVSDAEAVELRDALYAASFRLEGVPEFSADDTYPGPNSPSTAFLMYHGLITATARSSIYSLAKYVGQYVTTGTVSATPHVSWEIINKDPSLVPLYMRIFALYRQAKNPLASGSSQTNMPLVQRLSEKYNIPMFSSLERMEAEFPTTPVAST